MRGGGVGKKLEPIGGGAPKSIPPKNAPAKFEQADPFDNDGAFLLALERFGYDITEGIKAIEAFERRWRPERIEGRPDAQLGAILWQLLLERDQGLAR